MTAPNAAETSRYRRSVNLERDFSDHLSVEGYILSSMGKDLLRRILSTAFRGEGSRAFSLVGPYGTGKSAFALFLSMVVAGGAWREAARRALKAAWPKEELPGRELLIGDLLSVFVTGHRGDLGPTVLRSLVRAAELRWGDAVPAEVRSALPQSVPGPALDAVAIGDVVRKFVDGCRSAGLRGALIVVDECGKFLESALDRRGAADLYLLQILAEETARGSGGTLAVLTILHQDFDAYAVALPPSSRDEWSKVGGRFEVLPFLESPGHLVTLIGKAIQIGALRTGTQQAALFPGQAGGERAAKVFPLLPAGIAREEDLRAVYPLDPLVALCLGPLFRSSIGQNERSVFAFLTSSEPYGFQSWVSRRDGEYYTLDILWDYIAANTAPSMRQSRARVLAAAEDALLRLPKSATEVDAKIIKILALLQLVQGTLPLTVERPLIQEALGADYDVVDDAIERLRGASIVIHRRFRRAYQLWEGSDVDIDALLARYRDRVLSSGGFAGALQKEMPPLPVVAARHSHQTGTLRFLRARFTSPPEAEAAPSPAAGDGELLLVVPDYPEQLEGFAERFQARRRSRAERPLVAAVPGEPRELIRYAVEFLALDLMAKQESSLEEDRIALREVTDRRDAAADGLRQALVREFGARRGGTELRWLVRGEQKARVVNDRASAEASELFDKVFGSAPTIRNELVNREELSSAAAAARRELVKLVVTHHSVERLGIEGAPPHLSIYRSVLERGGIHVRGPNGGWMIQAPTDARLQKVWKAMDEVLGDSGRRVKASSLSEKLSDPPYGIRAGLADLLVVLWYYTRQGQVFFYEDGGFVPTVGGEHLEMLLRRPEGCEFQAATGERPSSVVSELAIELGVGTRDDTPSALEVARAVVSAVRKLSPWASSTNKVPETARRLRSVVHTAKDPLRLLMRELPAALGLTNLDGADVTPEQAGEYARQLSAALRELRAADDYLLEQIGDTIRGFFGEPKEGYYLALHERAAAISGADLHPDVARWVEIATSMSPTDSDSRKEWLRQVGTAIAGKPPGYWNDGDAAQFPHLAMEACRRILAAEELALEKRKRKPSKFRLLRVAVLDSDGQEHTSVGVVRPKERERARELLADFERLAAQGEGGEAGLAAAVIAALMERLTTSRREAHE